MDNCCNLHLYDIINRELLIKTTLDLIRLESHPKADGYERKTAEYIFNFLKSNGIEAWYQGVDGDRKNVIAKISGRDASKTLMLTGHMDTVGDYGHGGLFNPKIINNHIFGRGANDMKGPVAAMLIAADAISKTEIKPCMNVILAFVVDEEFRSIGMEALVKSGLRADLAILGEPTNMKVCLGNKGLEWINIEVKGKATHGGTANLGVNAISKAVKLISVIENELMPDINARNHEVLGNAAMNIGCISGGLQASSVPDRCLIKIDRRWIPGETSEGVYREFSDIINSIKNEDRDFEASVFRDDSGINEMEHGPVFMESQDRHVIQLLDCIKRITGKEAEVSVFPGWTEASLLSNFGNIPTLIYGAGDIGTAHSEKECVNIDDLYNSALVYGEIMLNYEGRE